MDLKTYRSKTMAGALAEVKKDLGPEAVILRTRSYKAGGVLGFGGNSIVEITAAKDTPTSNTYKPASRRSGSHASGLTEAGPASTPRAGAVTPSKPVRVEAVATARGAPADLAGQVSDVTDRAARRPVPATQVDLRPVSVDAQAALEAELASIRSMVSQVLQTTRRTAVHVDGSEAVAFATGGKPDPLFDLYNTLTKNELPPLLIDELIASARDELSTDELSDASIVRETLLRQLASRLNVVGPCESSGVGGGPIVETLIGPTGVGKTTTIAKLAAAHKLRYGRSVGLITADTYRIAAVEQLRTYAGIIGLPLEVVLTPDELGDAREKLTSCDVVLIDTPGRSPRDRARLDQLGAFLKAARPTRTHLVLSASSGPGVLRAAAERFGEAHPDCLLLSKLDEASGMGVIGHASLATGLPLSYVTTGQEVPDHIEPARPERLARLMLEGELEA